MTKRFDFLSVNKFPMHRILILAFAVILFASTASAQTREQKLAELVRAQGVSEMLSQTVEQWKTTAQQYGRERFAQLIAGAGTVDAAQRQRLDAALQRYLDRCATIWKLDELLSLWVTNYGQYLSEIDISQMLAYYKSPVGVKDVSAAKASMRAFLATTTERGQQRFQKLLEQLESDITTQLKAETPR